MIGDEFPRQIIKVRRLHARHHVRDEHVEAFGGDAAGLSHAFKIRIGMDTDRFGAKHIVGICVHGGNIVLMNSFG